MNAGPEPPSSAAALPRLLAEQVQALQPALEGFPVLDLVEGYADAATSGVADAAQAGRSYLLTHACLSSWQSGLELTIESYLPNADEAHQRVRARQEQTRDALATVRAMLVSIECRRAKTV